MCGMGLCLVILTRVHFVLIIKCFFSVKIVILRLANGFKQLKIHLDDTEDI